MRPPAAVAAAALAWTTCARADEPARGGAGPEQPSRSGIVMAGVHSRTLYGTPTWLATVSAGAAFSWFDLSVQAGRGRTTSSLVVSEVAVAGFLRFAAARRLQVGPTVAVGWLGVERVTSDDSLDFVMGRVGGRVELELAPTRFAPLLSVDVGVASPSSAFSALVAAGGRY